MDSALNLPFAGWTEVLGSERLTGALLDRLAHHVHIRAELPVEEQQEEEGRRRTIRQPNRVTRGGENSPVTPKPGRAVEMPATKADGKVENQKQVSLLSHRLDSFHLGRRRPDDGGTPLTGDGGVIGQSLSSGERTLCQSRSSNSRAAWIQINHTTLKPVESTPASTVSKLETPPPSHCRWSQKMLSAAARRFQLCAAYLASSFSRLCAGLGTATLPFRISWRVTLEPYMALSPLWSACTTAPSRLTPAKAPLLRE